MRAARLAIGAALMVAVSGAASAQTIPPPPPATTTATTADPYGQMQSHWTAAALVGGNFGGNLIDESSANFGGTIGYLWEGAYGFEATADYARNFHIPSALLADDPRLLTFMANAIVAVPLGAEGEFKPYFSAGIGRVSMKTDVFGLATNGTTISNSAHGTRRGGNIGGGFMGFLGNVGVRGDVRWYKASNDENVSGTEAADLFTETLVSALEFWRANGGVVVRW